MKTKEIFFTVSLMLISSIIHAQGFYHTITSQAEFEAANFPQSCFVTLDNDTSLPVNEQIHDLSPLATVDTLLLIMKKTRIADCSPLQELSDLFLDIRSDSLLSDVSCINEIPSVTGVYLENMPRLEEFIFDHPTSQFSNLIIGNCERVKTVDVNLPNLVVPDNPNQRLEVRIRYNDSLQNISIRNPNLAVETVWIEENRTLSDLYIENSYGLWLTFNPKLNTVSGYENDTVTLAFRAEYNYELEQVCDLKPNLEAFIDHANENNLDVTNFIQLNQNGPNTSTLQDILDYPCAPASVENNYTVSMGVYPNPTYGLLNIEDLQQITPYRLINLQGQLVQQGMAQPNQPLHLELLPSGIYFLELEGVKPVKVVKQ